jgi:hypothetical protein
MALTIKEFLKMIGEKHRRQGFSDDWEAFGAAFNWREVFGTDLPDNYYHPRDKYIIDEGMRGLRTEPPKNLENQVGEDYTLN